MIERPTPAWAHLRLTDRLAPGIRVLLVGINLIREALPLGLPCTRPRSPLRRLAPVAWLTR